MPRWNASESGDAPWIPAFLAELERTGKVHLAAQHAGLSRQHVYLYRAALPDFAHAWQMAIDRWSVDREM
jgi:DNA-binding phage protein